MKNLVLILVFLVVAIGANAQRIGTVRTIDVDTLQGSETVSFGTIILTGDYNALTIQGLCTEIGGTADGTLAVYGSLDNTNWTFVNGVGGEVITASPQASITGADLNQITITDALVPSWTIKDVPYKYFKVVGVGTLGDTTQVNLSYILK